MTSSDLETLFALWRAGDEAGAAAYFADDGIFHEAKKEPVVGRDTIAAHWKPFFHGGPEWRMTVHDLFGDPASETFAVSYTWEIKLGDGTWTGSPGCAIVQTRAGKISEWREYKG